METVDIVCIAISAVGIICGISNLFSEETFDKVCGVLGVAIGVIVIVSSVAPYVKPDNKDDDESTSEAQTEETTVTDNKQFIEIDGQRYELVPAEE